MNYLAHIYLSGEKLPKQLGGFIADAVKGKSYMQYSPEIAAGIVTHRAIDHFIDTHPLIIGQLQQMRPVTGKYSPVVLDIFLDHILASGFKAYTGKSLFLFSIRFYAYAIFNYTRLPVRFQRFVWHFVASDRLGKYKTESGIRQSLEIMKHYRGLDIDIDQTMHYLSRNNKELTTLFEQLLPELKELIQSKHIKHKNERIK